MTKMTRGFPPASIAATLAVVLMVSQGCKDITSGDDTAPPDGAPVAAAGDTVTILIQDFLFIAPNGTDSVTVTEGQTIRFVNRDVAPHTATTTDAPQGADFDSGELSQGDEYHWTPSATGIWVYRCDFHPGTMAGAVIRVGAGQGSGDDGGETPSDPTPPDPDVGPDTVLVEIVNFAFRAPDGTNRVTIRPGQSVKFVNLDDADHTATSVGGSTGFDSGNLSSGQVYVWTAPSVGDWSYICEYHDEMSGVIQVRDGTAGEDPPAETVSVDITDSGFVGPDGGPDVTVSVGQTIEWVNQDTQVHTVSATDAPDGGVEFDSGDLAPGQAFSFTPDRPGVWEYRCDEHSDEEGSITVQ
jgi:plastocyanin